MPAQLVKVEHKSADGEVVAEELQIDLSTCRGAEFKDNLKRIQGHPARRYDPENKLWVMDASAKNLDWCLRTLKPEAEPHLIDWLRAQKLNDEESLLTPIPDDDDKLLVPWAYKRCDWQPEEVNEEPFDGLLPYQRAAVGELLRGDRRYILGDDMGLGKTLTLISAVEEYRLRHKSADGVTVPDGPKLVICPNSVKGSWARELRRWLPEDTPVKIIDGKTAAKVKQQLEEAIQEDAWVILNWEAIRAKKVKVQLKNGGEKMELKLKHEILGATDWLAVIADECHKAKNRKAQQTQGLWKIKGKMQFGATGTSVLASPDDLWAMFAWLWPDQYHPRGAAHAPGAVAYWTFFEQFVDYYEDLDQRKVITGVKNADAFKFVLNGKLIRRTSKILGLKGRRRIFFELEMEGKQLKAYKDAERAMWLELEKEAKEGNEQAKELIANPRLLIKNAASRMVRQLQILESPATLGGDDDSVILDDCEERILDSRPEPWVVFTKYKITNYLLKSRLEKHGLTVAVYNGDVSTEERTQIENDFQAGNIDVVVGTIDAMYQGITLTRAHLMYFTSRDFTPDINEQAEARCDRLGQQFRVMVYIPQVKDSVAVNKVTPINRLKEQIVRAILPKDEIKEVYE